MRSLLNIQYAHVHSHNLHPFNDYVDSLCTHVHKKIAATHVAFGPIGDTLVRSIDHYCAQLCNSVAQQVMLPVGFDLDEMISIDSRGIGMVIDGSSGPPLPAFSPLESKLEM